MSGFGDGIRKFAAKLEKATESGFVPMDEMFPPAFMKAHTKLATIGELLEPLGIRSQDDLENTSREALDAAVQRETEFDSWSSMKKAAVVERFQRRLAE